MKPYTYLLLLPLLVGCSSKDIALKTLEANAQQFSDTVNTEYLLTNTAIVYFTLKGNELHLQLINKDIQSDVKIQSCSVNHKEYPVIEDKTKKWDNNYIVTLDKSLNRVSVKCTLTSGDTIAKTIRRK